MSQAGEENICVQEDEARGSRGALREEQLHNLYFSQNILRAINHKMGGESNIHGTK